MFQVVKVYRRTKHVVKGPARFDSLEKAIEQAEWMSQNEPGAKCFACEVA